MEVSLSKFVKLPIGDKNTVYYGLFTSVDKILFFEINDINNPFEELRAMDDGQMPEVKKMIFAGGYKGPDVGYKDTNTNKAINHPTLVRELQHTALDFFGGDIHENDFLNFVGLENGIICALQYGADPEIMVISNHKVDGREVRAYSMLCG